ncbi:YtxH domain-containing protein [Bacillaceae bacterium Marseille-Q3522]|nr:YtxH domain-containing protein [Bacillaceae bacterium Marseille-Q3522]
MKAKSFLLGIIAGSVVAGISVLLNAPASGQKTRQNLLRNKDIWLKQIQELKANIFSLMEAAKAATGESKTVIAAFISDMKMLLADWKADIRPHQEAIQKELTAIEKAVDQLTASLNKNE